VKLSKDDFLEGDALNEELKALESHFPGILTITDEEIETMERQLKFLENDTKERKERIIRMEGCEKRQLRDIEALEKKHFELDYQGKQLEEECMQKACNLERLQKSNQKKIVDLKQTYTQPVS
jgi:chromosome segregation ATPase